MKNAMNRDLIVVSLDGGMSLWISGHRHPFWIYNCVWETKVETYEILSCFLACLLETLSEIDLGKPHFFNLFFGE
jgi:hypothetical protein